MSRVATRIDRKVGARVRKRRLELRISQERFADLLSVTFQQVQKYEKGTNRIAASRLYRMTQVLDVNAAYFFQDLDRVHRRASEEARR